MDGSLTGLIAGEIESLHREGVLKEMKRLYFEEFEKFFLCEGMVDPSMVVEVGCPVCSSKSTNKVITINGFNHVLCPTCGNVFVNPRLKAEYIMEQYNSPSYTYMFQNLIENTLNFRKEIVAYGKYKWVVKRLKKKRGRMLDIGSGLGENLAIYQENGWDVTGIEFNEYAAKRSWELFGVKVLNEPIESVNFKEKFDLITMWGVLEHLVDPVSVLRGALRVLEKNGSLVLMVPNYESLMTRFLKLYPERAERHLDGMKHLTIFTKKGVEFLAKKLGLKVIDIATRGLDLITISRSLEEEAFESRFHDFVKGEIPVLQRSLEDCGFGDSLWVVLRKK